MKNIKNMNLNTKFLISIIITSLIIYASIFSYIGIRMEYVLRHNVELIANNYVSSYANLFKSYLSEDKQIARTLANNLETLTPVNHQEKIDHTIDFLKRTFLKHPKYRAIYTSWERKYVDPNWTEDYGRIRYSISKPANSNSNIPNLIIDTLDTDSDEINSSYYRIKTNQKDELVNPYEDIYYGKKETVTSVFNAMSYNGKFIGSTGIDIPFSRYSEIIDEAKKFHNSNIFLLSNNGIFVGNQTKKLVGTSITNYIQNTDTDIITNIKEGKVFSLYMTYEGVNYYVTFYPFTITGTNTPWSVGVAVPNDSMIIQMKKNFFILLIVGSIGTLIMILVIYFLIKGISEPITGITKMLKLLSEGKIDNVKKIETNRRDEIGDIINSANQLITNLQNTSNFAKEIGYGKLETPFESLGDEDILGNSLLNMQQNLRNAKIESAKRRTDEKKQNWATIGYAKFSEILRQNADNMESLTNNVLSELIKYTNANQGAFFLLNTENKEDIHLVMSAHYAYDRKKSSNKRIEIGSGLVGQCFLEGESLFYTDIPENYINITSGLGDAPPTSLLIVPLKFNNTVFGIIEIASFYVFEKYQIDFIKKLAESIASTISTVQINTQTSILLEESKRKSEELAAQDEDLRRNMNELQNTQERSAIREIEMNGILTALNSSYGVLELDPKGKILKINDKAISIINIKGAAEGRYLKEFIPKEELSDFEDLWSKVIIGESIKVQRKIMRGGKEIKIAESYTPIYNIENKLYKILNIGVEII